MKITRKLLPILFVLSGASMLHADGDPTGTYQGTIQCTTFNEQGILQMHFTADSRDSNGTVQQNNQEYLNRLKQESITNANPFQLGIEGAPGNYALTLAAPGNVESAQERLGDMIGLWWDGSTFSGPVHISWTADGFDATRTQGTTDVYRMTGHYNGSSISGQWSFSVNGTTMLAGVFNVSKNGGSGSAGGPGGSSSGGAGSSQQGAAAGGGSDPRGTYNGTYTWTYYYEGPGGKPLSPGSPQSLVVKVTNGPSAGLYRVEFNSFNTPFRVWDPAANSTVQESWTGNSFAVSETEGNHIYKISGSINGPQISGNLTDSYKDTLMMGYQFSASRSGGGGHAGGGPVSSGGHWEHTGEGNDADDYTWVSDSQPPGISGVNDVPGPADIPETATGILLPGMLTMLGIGVKSMLDSSVTPPPLVDYGLNSPDGSDDNNGGGSGQSGDSPASAAPAAPSQYGTDYDQAVKDGQTASDNYDKILKQYADFQNGADKNDPHYQELDQQYKDNLNYWKQQADSSKASASAIADAAEKQRNTQVLKDYWGNDKEVVYDPATGQWHDARTGNLFDPDAWQKSQQDNADADAWGQSQTQLMENRQDTDSKILLQMMRDEKKKEAELTYLTKLQKMAFDTDLTDPGGAHDVFLTTQKMMNDLLDNKTVAVPQILETRQYLHDRLLGNAAPESILSLPENQPVGFINSDGAYRTLRSLVTGRDADGNFSFLNLAGAAAFNIAANTVLGPVATRLLGSTWAVDATLVAANTVYAEHDAIAHGASGWGALGAGALTAVVQGGPQAAGGLLLQYAPGSSISMMIKRVVNPMSESQAYTRSMVDRALASDNPADLVRLYRGGGMTRLGDLQAAGHLTEAEAAALNSRLGAIVNGQVDDATRLAMRQFQSRTGVRIEQTIIADSGSSARGASKNAFTDFDRTQVTRFNQADLEQYAIDHRISVEEANHNLQSLFGENIHNNVDIRLRDSGFIRGTGDLHFNTYNGIGAGAGQLDAYGAGFTGMRMKVQGVGTQYNANAAGNLTSVRNITGTAVVDQHGLNVAQITGRIPPNPDKFSPDEFLHFSNQQVMAVQNYTDPKSVAKALMRQNDLATKVNHMAGNSAYEQQLIDAGFPVDGNGNLLPAPQLDSKVVAIANAIKKNPAQANQILAANNLTNASFRDRVAQELVSYHNGIGGAAR